MTGFSQVFIGIFMPVWSDKYAPSEGSKQCWLSGVLMASTIGVLIGYVFTAVLISMHNWRYSFYLQAIVVIPFEIMLIMTPAKYLSIKSTSEDSGK
jgi:MFS family permease